MTFRRVIPILLTLTAAWSQTPTAELRGTVRDGSNAAVPDAIVSLTNHDQQQRWTSRTANNGEYTVDLIPPGNYLLAVEAQGFKKYERDLVALQVAETKLIDIALELGEVTETLRVTVETPLLEAASSFLGEVVGGSSVEALPLVSRNITQLVALSPGIGDTPNFRQPAFSSGNPSRVQFSASGGRGITNEIIVDGSPQTVMDLNEPAYIPQPEAVQEFNVQRNSLPAEYGRTGGAVINIVHRSGGKEFHGELYEFLRNDALYANDFFSNARGVAKAPTRGNEFGFALGGPASRSRKSTFFFVNYQRILISTPMPSTFTVPTARMKKGDFSELAVPVYDPLSTDANGNRRPFPNNYIPPDRWNPVGVNLLHFYPDPTSPGIANNFFSNLGQHVSSTDMSLRIDRNVSERNRLFGRFSLGNWDSMNANRFGNVASPNVGPMAYRGHSAALDDTHSMGKWLLHANFGYVLSSPQDGPAAPGFDLTSLGFPAYLNSVVQVANVPTISFPGLSYSGLGESQGVNTGKFENYTVSADAAKVTGRHAVKFGWSYRVNRASFLTIADSSGSYSFTEGFTRQDLTIGAQGGNPIASLLLGLPAVPQSPNAGSIGYQPALALQSRYTAFYLQDDWRIGGCLTLNIGLRWDSERPVTERYDRTSWFDFSADLPLAAPGLKPLTGGLRFAGVNGASRGSKNPDNNNLGPRIGLAYKVNRTTVLRSGFGLMYAPATGIGPNTGNSGAASFSSSTPYISSQDGHTLFTTLSNPFPNGFNTPQNASDGLLTLLGQSVQAQVRGDRTPYAAQWHFNLQRELRNDMLFDIGYAGSAGVKLLAVMQLNQLPNELLALGNALNRSVPNPFFGFVSPKNALGGSMTTLGQLLRPYPQFVDVTYDWGSFAHSTYHALEAKFRKRYRGGLQTLAVYTWSKTLDNISGPATGGDQNPPFIDNNRLDLSKSYSSFDIPHRLVMSFEYDLPFGLGRPLLNHRGLINAIAGGWRVSGIGTIQSGPPLSVITKNASGSFNGGNLAQRPNRTGVSSRTPGSVEDRLNNYIDRAAFIDPAPFTFGNSSRFLPENRAPGLQEWDVSFAKTFAIQERIRVDFRAETFNLLNHPKFLAPAINFSDASFGTITKAELPRNVQLALKIRF